MITGNRKAININMDINRNFVFIFILPLFLCFCFVSCDPKKKETDLGVSFRRIYDKPETTNYFAVDIKQIPDEGYIILGKIGERPYLLKVDMQGDFLWDTKDEDTFKNYIYPVPDLLLNQENQGYYFFCNKIFNESCEDFPDDIEIPTLLKFSEENKSEVEEVTKICFQNLYRGYKYSIKPTYASIIGKDNYLLLTSNSWGDVVTFIGEKNIGIGWKDLNNNDYWNGYDCFVPYPSADKRFHYTGIFKKTRKYYFHTFFRSKEANFDPNCFVMRMEAPDGSDSHVEFSLERPFIAMEWDDTQWDVSNWESTGLNGLELSGAYINDNNNVSFFVNSEIKVNEETQQPQIKLNVVLPQRELFETKPVYIKRIPVNDQVIVFFAGSTKFGKIGLYAYSLLENELLGKKYFGEIRLYEASGLIKTDDGGLAVLGTTYVMDRLQRICLFKLSKAEVEEIVSSDGS